MSGWLPTWMGGSTMSQAQEDEFVEEVDTGHLVRLSWLTKLRNLLPTILASIQLLVGIHEMSLLHSQTLDISASIVKHF